jgi:peptidoglycan hydrolase-like protein with peptidoglycan-binding domain
MYGSRYFLYAFLSILLVSVSGCGLTDRAYQKEADEEKKIIGYSQRYNSQWGEIKEFLKKAGFDPGPGYGGIGSKARAAIRSFQKANNLKVTGFVDSKTWAKLNTYILEEDRSSVLSQPQRKIKKEIISEPDISPMGKEELQDEVIRYRLKSSDRIKNAQNALIAAGFDPGPIDGKMGTKTKKALADFQRKHGLNSDGVIGPKTQEALDRYLFNQDIK